MDMIYDPSFQIQKKIAKECAAFRQRAVRRKGGQKEDEEQTKKKEWDVMICVDWEDSDDSETEHWRGHLSALSSSSRSSTCHTYQETHSFPGITCPLLPHVSTHSYPDVRGKFTESHTIVRFPVHW